MTLHEAKIKYPNAITFTFGDNEVLCNKLLELVRSGQKTATCEDVRRFEANPQEMPVLGRRDIALKWNGSPALVIETIDLKRIRFCDVDEELALAEGENDSLTAWQADHQKYFERNLGFFSEMELIFERFRLIEIFA